MAIDTTRKPATQHTANANRAAVIDFDRGDYERTTRGLIAQIPDGRITSPTGLVVWDMERYGFLRSDEVPDTVHPSLWRQAQLNNEHGLFEVAPGVWQARGYDISSLTFIAGTEGWIIIDPLTSEDCARASLDLANTTLGARPVTAVIYTHSHADHFGGVRGVTSDEDVAAGRCRVIAPIGFLHEAVSENLLAGPAMLRRANYQFGPFLPAGPRAHVDCGLGKAVPLARAGLIAPTEDITHTGQELVVDGIRIVFQLTPETEAPAEMNFFFPDHGWLCMAENCTHTMHNLVPIRGAKVRDALAWSKYIGEALDLFGDRTELFFASHNWPRWGRDDVRAYLVLQRDLYRWMHDQTLRLANGGATPTEIAAALELPPEFLSQGHTRGYYGSLVHNVKAVYQRYLSWYDANPSHLHPHEPTEAGRRYVEFMGGPDAVVEKAQVSFDAGDYRWVCEVLNHVVFGFPDHEGARQLQSDSYEQLGYQSESTTFRNAYLMAAQELRSGPPAPRDNRGGSMLAALTTPQIFELLGVRLQAENVGGVHKEVAWHFTDVDEHWRLELSNRTLSCWKVRSSAHDASVTTTRPDLLSVILGDTTVIDAVRDGRIAIEGDPQALITIFTNLDVFRTGFNIVEP